MRAGLGCFAGALTLLAPVAAVDAQAAATLELRVTPPFVRPFGPSLGGRVAVPVSHHLWLGGGYELFQDYDAILWTAKDTGHKPIVLSALHAGGWYRGDTGEPGLTWAVGGVVSFAHSTISLAPAPDGIDRGTYVIDVGPDLSIGRTRNGTRIEAFVTPAWSWGRVASPAVGTSEGLSRFTYRVGIAFAVSVGS